MTISNEMAWRLRSERGLPLPTDREYESARIKEIAKRQREILDEYDALDIEILSLCTPGLKPLDTKEQSTWQSEPSKLPSWWQSTKMKRYHE